MGCVILLCLISFLQEAKLSQETLDQVVKTNEEKYGLTEKLEAANKVEQLRSLASDSKFL